MTEESAGGTMPTPSVRRANGGGGGGPETRFRAIATDLVLLGVVCAYFAPWMTFFACLVVSAFLRIRRRPRFKETMAILNEIIAENTNKSVADFIAPMAPEPHVTWVQTANGTIPMNHGEP